MSTSIRVSEATKAKLEAIKRDEETFDELLDRIVVDRSTADVENLLGRAEGMSSHMASAHEELSRSLEGE